MKYEKRQDAAFLDLSSIEMEIATPQMHSKKSRAPIENKLRQNQLAKTALPVMERTTELENAPDGGDAWAPAKPRPDETLIRALARAHRWKRLLEEGAYRSAAELAESEKITRSFVNRLLRLTLLAPDIQESILDGRQPKGMQLEEVVRGMPSAWEEQRIILRLP